MGDTLADLYRQAGITPAWENATAQPPVPMRARRSLPQLNRAPNAPAARAYNARRQGGSAAQDFAERGVLQNAYAPPRNQVAELPGMALEMTGLPSIRRSAAAFASGDPGTGTLEGVQGGIGLLSLAAGMRGARAAPRAAEPAPAEFPNFGSEPQWMDAYRGLKQPFNAERATERVEWWADNPDTAWTYARSNNGGNIIPGRINTADFLEVDADGNSYLAVPVDRIGDPRLRAAASLEGKYDTAETNRIARVAREYGYDGIVFRNIRDDSEGVGPPGNVVAVLNPDRRQSRFGPLTNPPTRIGADALQNELRHLGNTAAVDINALPEISLRTGELPYVRPLGPAESDTVAAYARRSAETAPPIIIRRTADGVQIIDGHHRVMAARRRGDAAIRALDSSELFDPPPKPSASQTTSKSTRAPAKSGLFFLGDRYSG